jgi:hypothetical protein
MSLQNFEEKNIFLLKCLFIKTLCAKISSMCKPLKRAKGNLVDNKTIKQGVSRYNKTIKQGVSRYNKTIKQGVSRYRLNLGKTTTKIILWPLSIEATNLRAIWLFPDISLSLKPKHFIQVKLFPNSINFEDSDA